MCIITTSIIWKFYRCPLHYYFCYFCYFNGKVKRNMNSFSVSLLTVQSYACPLRRKYCQ